MKREKACDREKENNEGMVGSADKSSCAVLYVTIWLAFERDEANIYLGVISEAAAVSQSVI